MKRSPCIGCENVGESKLECSKNCERLAEWQKSEISTSAYGGQQSNFLDSGSYGTGKCSPTGISNI